VAIGFTAGSRVRGSAGTTRRPDADWQTKPLGFIGREVGSEGIRRAD
jgi:hypothetical protein